MTQGKLDDTERIVEMVASLAAASTIAPLARAKAFLVRHELASFVGLTFAWSWSVAWIETLVPGGAGPAFQFGPVNAASVLLPLSTNAYALAFLVQWLVAIAVVVRARMWRRTPANAPNVHVSWPATGRQTPAPPALARS